MFNDKHKDLVEWGLRPTTTNQSTDGHEVHWEVPPINKMVIYTLLCSKENVLTYTFVIKKKNIFLKFSLNNF